MRKIAFCIIGTGTIAERHIMAINALDRGYIYGVYDLNRERAAEFAKHWNVKCIDSFDDVLNNSEIKAVTIATPTGTHMDIAFRCANSKKHILCEKPLDVNVERAEKIIKACEDNNVVLSAVFQSRFGRNAALIKNAIDTGRFGKLLLVSAQVKWYRSNDYYDTSGWRGTWAMDGGGALMNQSVHIIDLLLWFTGEPNEVYAYTNTMTHNMETEDNASAIIQFKNGATGVIQASTSCAPGFPRVLEISGEKGSVILEDDRITRWQFIDEAHEDSLIRETGKAGEGLNSGASDPRNAGFEGHRRQLEDMVDAILTGTEPKIPGREGIKAIKLICAMYRSHKDKKPVRV